MADYDWGAWVKESEESIKKWIDTRQKLLVISIYEKTAISIAQLLYYIIFGLLFTLFLFFLCIALGFYLSELMGSNLKGFGTVSLIFLSILLLVGVVAKKVIKRSIADTMVRELIKNDKNDETI